MKEALNNISLRQLHIFTLAAEAESYSYAAGCLNLTPPAVSMQMKRLSEMIGIDLFEKRGRRLYLTRAGKSLLSYAQVVIETLRQANEELDAIKGLKRGQIKIGMVTTTQYFAPKLAAEFKALFPHIDIDISIENRANLISKLENSQIDIAIMGRLPRLIPVESTKFAEHPYVVIAPKNHHLVGKNNITAKMLQEENFLTREPNSGTHMILDSFFSKNKLPHPNMTEFSNNESIKQSVIAGMGLAFISAHTIQLETKSKLLRILDVKNTPIIKTWYTVQLKNRHLGPAVNAFRQFIQHDATEHMERIFSANSD